LARPLIAWHREHGRHDLPWQRPATPYRVWVSEVMLQQTRVATVIPYFERFMARLPSIRALAAASEEEVLALWSGLGYYARARNLRRAAQQIVTRHGGRFPVEMEAVTALPGIGPSTAGAILTLACGQRHPILDGNARRVLARYHAVAGWPGHAPVERRLWALAEQRTPERDAAIYTQAIMDLGATLCRRNRPDCPRCPLQLGCRANREGRQARYPAPRPRRRLPHRTTTVLLITNEAGELLLERRPSRGIWGGLWSLPELCDGLEAEAHCRELGLRPLTVTPWPERQHTFTHFRLTLRPLHIVAGTAAVMEGERRVWYKTDSFNQLGLPAPIERLLQQLNRENRGA